MAYASDCDGLLFLDTHQTLVPHFVQNLEPLLIGEPHFTQNVRFGACDKRMGAPHIMQNFVPSSCAAPQT